MASPAYTAGPARPQPPGAVTGRRLIPLTDWPQFHPWPTVSALRHYRFLSANDPAYAAWRRVFRTAGRRVLIDEGAFFEVLDSQTAGGGQ